MEHQRQIGIRNAPVAKKVCSPRGQQLLGHLEQFVSSFPRGGAGWLSIASVEASARTNIAAEAHLSEIRRTTTGLYTIR
ncbi:hypothetical protein ACWKWV_14200 [Castellaniella ginsengisoli]